jgi:hypothetical protein
MASDLTVQTIRGPASGANANKVLIPSGQTLTLEDKLAHLNMPTSSIVQVKSLYSNVSASMSGSQTFTNSGVYIDITPRFSTSTLIVHAQGHIWRNAAGHNWFRVINQTTGQVSGVRGGRDQYSGYHEDVNIIWHQTAGNTNTQRFEIQFADRDNNSSVGLYFNDGGGYQSGMIVYEVVA